MLDMLNRRKKLEDHMKGVREIFDAIESEYDSMRERLLREEGDAEAMRRTLFEGIAPSRSAKRLRETIERIEKSPHENLGWYEHGVLCSIAREVEAMESRAGRMECILQEVRTLLINVGADDCVVTVVTGDDTRTIDSADIIGRIDELGIEVNE